MQDLYDSDILKIEKVVDWMQAQQGRSTDLEGFRRAAIEKFNEAGFDVDLQVWSTTEEGVYHFEPVIKGKLTPKAFDYERMQHEVRNNILELPGQDGGIIRADAELARIERKRQMGMLPKHKH